MDLGDVGVARQVGRDAMPAAAMQARRFIGQAPI